MSAFDPKRTFGNGASLYLQDRFFFDAQITRNKRRSPMQRHIFSLALLISMLAFGSTVVMAEGKKNGFITDTISTSQGSSGKPCNSPNGCTTISQSSNKAGNNVQPPTCQTNVDSKCN